MNTNSFNWNEHFIAYKESGLGMKQYCEQHDIGYHNFSARYYKQKKVDSTDVSWSKVLIVDESKDNNFEFIINNVNIKVNATINPSLLTLLIKSVVAI